MISCCQPVLVIYTESFIIRSLFKFFNLLCSRFTRNHGLTANVAVGAFVDRRGAIEMTISVTNVTADQVIVTHNDCQDTRL